MLIEYDPQVDALYIRLVEGSVQVTTQRLSEDIAVNYAPDGSIVGFEILDASEHVGSLTQEPQVTVQNLKAKIA
jgi:uncharacterized protein YuzE